jgi:hypothetical protein
MKTFDIEVAGYEGRSVEITRYMKTSGGIEIKIRHDIPSKKGVNYFWAQTITENGSFFQACKRRDYVDPYGPTGATDASGNNVCAADDNKPFYWTDAEFFGTGGTPKEGPFFFDRPSETPPATGRT